MKRFLLLVILFASITQSLVAANIAAKECLTEKDCPVKPTEIYKQFGEKYSSPNNFETQEFLNQNLSESEMGLIMDGNPQSLRDEKIKDINAGDRKMSNSYLEAMKPNAGDAKCDGENCIEFALQKTIGQLGDNVAKSTKKVSCYVARSQSFYSYRCSANQMTYGDGGEGNRQSPTAIKKKCQENCYGDKSPRCVKVEPTKKGPKDVMLGTFFINKKNKDKIEIIKKVNQNINTLEFSFKGKQKALLSFQYTTKDPDSKDPNRRITKIPAEDALIAGGEGGKEVKKRFFIKDFVDEVTVVFKPSNEAQLENEDIVITAATLKTKINKNYVCPADNIRADNGILKLCRPDDIVEFKITEGEQGAGEIVEVCKSRNEGDNEDGSYSTEDICNNSCKIEGTCTLVTPVLDPNSFFGFQEGCMTGEDEGKNCSESICRAARENLAPILNEWVYDGKGNRTQTIMNGMPVQGVVRPRILASQSQNYNEKIQEEAKELARSKMLQEQTYAVTAPVEEERETSYASKVEKNQSISLLVKPSNTLYSKRANLYVVVKAMVVTPQWKLPKDFAKSWKTEILYIVDNFGDFHPFWKHYGVGVEGYGPKFETFSKLTKKWSDLDKEKDAPIVKSYDDLLDEVKKNKYYVKFPFQSPTEINKRLEDGERSGIPYRRKFIKRGEVSDITSGMGNSGGSSSGKPNPSELEKLAHEHFLLNYGPDKPLESFYSKEDFEKRVPVQTPEYMYLTQDVVLGFQIYTIMSDKKLTYQEIAKMVEDNKEPKKNSKNDHAVWNSTGDTKGIKSILRGDEVEDNEYVSIYLVGDTKKLSAYANINTHPDDKAENGYFFLWSGIPNKNRDDGIQNLKPDETLKIHDFKKTLFSKYDDKVLFEDQDYSDKKSDGIGYGYGTGKFENKDCQQFQNTENGLTERICLPWWKIEREYDKKEDTTIKNKDIQKIITSIQTPMEGKKVRVCKKVDPFANAIYNANDRTLTCSTYYSKLLSKDCFKNPKQAECFVDTCNVAMKNNCVKKHSFEFANPNQGDYIKTDDTGRSYEELGETKVGVKGYSYKCPATGKIEINKKCIEEDIVKMNPVSCNPKDYAITDEDKLKGKSGWIYCDTHKPIYNSDGSLKGFSGTCPNGTKVTCGFNQLATITKTCSKPIEEEVTKKVVSIKTLGRNCNDVYVDVSGGEKDIYKDSKNCFRTNSAADDRGGKDKLVLRNDSRVPSMRLTAVKDIKEGGIEEDIFCIQKGEHPNMPSQCKKNTDPEGKFIIDTSYTIEGDSQILFVEQMGTLDSKEKILGGITLDDTFDIDTIFRYEKHNRYGKNGWMKCDKDNEKSNYVTGDFWKNPKNAWHLTFPTQKHRGTDFNFYASSTSFSFNDSPISLFPDVETWNFQFLTKECTKSSRIAGSDGMPHCHNYRWDTFCHISCAGGDSALGRGKWWDDHIIKRDERALKLYKNSGTGLTILFPSASRYQIAFYNKEGKILTRRELDRSEIRSGKAGELKNIGFGAKVISSRGQEIRDILLPQIEKEIETEEQRIISYQPIERNVQTFTTRSHKTWYGKRYCSFGRASTLRGTTCYGTNKHPLFNLYGYYVDPQEWALKKGDAQFHLGRYNKNAPLSDGNTFGYNVVLPLDFFDKLDALKKKRDELKAELKEESVYTCASDLFSPIGGGMHFEKGSGAKHIRCDKTRSMDYIKKNSIYKVVITDLESNKTFEKKLTFPLPYINRIYYTYIKDVDRRAYRCCQDF